MPFAQVRNVQWQQENHRLMIQMKLQTGSPKMVVYIRMYHSTTYLCLDYYHRISNYL
jgi:hypothetical protein